jgi:hypothetical protein
MLAVVREMYLTPSDQNMNAQEQESGNIYCRPPERNFTTRVCRLKVSDQINETLDEGRRLGRKVRPSERYTEW